MLKTFLLIFTVMIANANIDEEKFKDIISEDQEMDFVDKSEKLLDVQTVVKFDGNYKINPEFKEITQKEYYSANKQFEKALMFKEIFETRFKFNLYDDITLKITMKFDYKHNMLLAAYNSINSTDHGSISRILNMSAGFWLDWFALDWLKIGIKGGMDEKEGYLFALENRLYTEKDSDTPKNGYDAAIFNVIIFSEGYFKFKSFFRIEPKIEFSIGKKEVSPGLTLSLDSIQFIPKISSAMKFDFNLTKDVDLKLQLTPSVYKSFGAKDDYSFGLSAESNLKYKVKMVTLSLSLNGEYALENTASVTSNKLEFKTIPAILFDYNIFQGMFLVANTSLDYMFFGGKLGEPEFGLRIDPDFKYGLGIRFASDY